MDPIYIFIALILLALMWKWVQNQRYPVVYVRAQTNGKEYLVRNLPDKQAAANMLGDMNTRFDKLIAYVQQHVSGGGNEAMSGGNESGQEQHIKLYKLYVLKDNTAESEAVLSGEAVGSIPFRKFIAACRRLVNNYNPDAISENTPDSAYTSYSENKGQRIVFCIRAKRTNKMVDLNTMMFVGIHELAHLMTQSIGHTPEFWENMRVLLRLGIRLGIYDCKNYNVESKDYCGTKITDTPLKCGDV